MLTFFTLVVHQEWRMLALWLYSMRCHGADILSFPHAGVRAGQKSRSSSQSGPFPFDENAQFKASKAMAPAGSEGAMAGRQMTTQD